MAKITALVPREYMKEQAEIIIQDDNYKDISVRVIETSEAVEAARKAVSDGSQIIVARGLQASIIKANTKVPVVEIRLSAQELGILITQGKKILRKKKPQFALIGYENMFCNLSFFDQIFDIRMKEYFVTSFEQFDRMVDQAIEDGADMILGGDVVVNLAQQHGCQALFLSSTQDSIRIAFETAKNVSYALDVESRSVAQLETVMDTAFNGIVKIDAQGRITVINRMIEELIKKSATEVSGLMVNQVLHDIDMDVVQQILSGKRDTYSSSIRIGGQPLFFIMAPIQSGTDILGAILSCNRMKSSTKSDAKTIREMYLNGYVARQDFSSWRSRDEKMKKCLELGRKFALSAYPIILYGETGTEKEVLAQCIHNNSARKSNPFGIAQCSGMSAQEQFEFLFGERRDQKKSGLIRICNHGTVFIPEIEILSEECQAALFNSIKSRGLETSLEENVRALDVRIIAGSCTNLEKMMQHGQFRKDLFYALNALNVTIPPIRERKSDMEAVILKRIKEFSTNHSIFLKLTSGAVDVMLNYEWPGNWVQLDGFCERLFLTTDKKNIDEVRVRQLLEELYQQIEIREDGERIVIYRSPEAKKLQTLLEKYCGNRQLVAQELGISTTTLWRHMKKYGVSLK